MRASGLNPSTVAAPKPAAPRYTAVPAPAGENLFSGHFGLALPLAGDDPERGAPAAVLGYPNGGPLRVVGAAVAGGYPATGRNIYGTERVKREIVEIRSDIERGNSGGPLMLSDGTVGGVVFAEARTDDEVGYALAPTAVAARINPFIGSAEPVSTGECLLP